MHIHRLVAAALVTMSLIGACGGSGDDTSTAQRPTATTAVATAVATTIPPLRLLVLGDSIAIPSMGCGTCTGFDEQYRTYLEATTGRPVILDNEARPNAQIQDLQRVLDTDTKVQQLIEVADVVVVSIGYNNGPPWSPEVPCHPKEGKVDTDLLVVLRDFTDSCIAATNEGFRDDFDGVYARIEELASGRAQVRIDLGNFNNALGNPGGDGTLPKVWAGEDVPGFPQSDLPRALANMQTAIAGYNAVECETATAHGFVCAGLIEAFNGPDGTGSLAEYVNPADYVHPNVTGQKMISDLLQKIDMSPIEGG